MIWFETECVGLLYYQPISITSAWSRDEVEKVEKRTNQNSEKTNGKYYGPMRGRYYPPIQAKYSWPFLKNKKILK